MAFDFYVEGHVGADELRPLVPEDAGITLLQQTIAAKEPMLAKSP